MLNLLLKIFEFMETKCNFLVDSEIWPNLVLTSKENKIPLCVINARLTKKSFKRWMLFPKSTKKIFQSIDLFLASNLETKNFLNELKIKNIIYNGNIKLFGKIDKKIYNPNEQFLLKKDFGLSQAHMTVKKPFV